MNCLHRLLLCLLLAGCALVDQNTFAPAPEAKAQPAPPPPIPVKVDPRTPLVTIDYGGPPPSYAELLRYAVRAAERRDAEVQFDVVSIVPKASEAADGQPEAEAVMHEMMLAGVPASRIHLGLRADPTLSSREVRVYVR